MAASVDERAKCGGCQSKEAIEQNWKWFQQEVKETRTKMGCCKVGEEEELKEALQPCEKLKWVRSRACPVQQ